MTVSQSTTPELDSWLGPRRQHPSTSSGDALSKLRPEDAEGQGGTYANRHEQAQRNRRAAVLIGLLWGVEYETAGAGIRATMIQAGRQVIIECGNSLETVEAVYREMDSDEIWRNPCKLCQSAYSIAGRMKAYYAVRQAKAAKASPDYLAGMTVDEWQAQAAENARIKAESMAQRKAAKEEWAEEEKARQAALLEMRATR